jgi:ribosome-associated heat shock protein Hsp15
MADDDGEPTRIDIWLDVACLFKTRSEAQRACGAGKVELNGAPAKQNRVLKVGDEIRITRGAGRRQIVTVLAFAARHVSKAEARMLYDDKTPAPTPEEVEMHRLDRQFWDGLRPASTPDRRQRRELRRLKGRE